MAQTLYWYDLETFGLNPQLDRVAQFAGIRTTDNFEIIGEPLVLYNRITPDYVPDPKACLITGITPQKTLEEGIPEREFISKIDEEFSKPGTCVVGYNNLNFDDEFIRNMYYRNFYDPYTREWTNGNTRWDIIDLVRAAHDLRPEGINWLRSEKNKPLFKLDKLTLANGIEHANAHDALADVYATIALAKLIYEKQPKLLRYLFSHRTKNSVRQLVNLQTREPLVYTSSVFTSERGCTSIVAPISVDPSSSNSLYLFDLRYDPTDLINLPENEIKRRMFTPDKELKENERLHIVKMQTNKCPALSPVSTVDGKTAERLGLDKDRCMANSKKLNSSPLLTQKFIKILSNGGYGKSDADPDLQIYSGGFFKDKDKVSFEIIKTTPSDKLFDLKLIFQDTRIQELLWRYKCRNYPEYMNQETNNKWKSFCAGRLLLPPGKLINDYHFFRRKVKENLTDNEIESSQKIVLKALDEYGEIIRKDVLEYT
ncbi:MAG: exodeoxyribonuclease I [Spirochaetota bacterium]|nr:exodeoxyribonuclease I [Spirochaetota bacterium]